MDIIDKNTFVGLAKEIYKLTLLFPKKEPLRRKLRENANDILAEFVMAENDYADNLERRFDLAESYLEIAEDQNWVAPHQIGLVKEEIKRIREDFFTAESSMRQEWKDVAEAAAQETDEDAFAPQWAGERDFILIPTAPKTEIIAPLPQDLMMPETAAPLPEIDETIVLPVQAADESGRVEENEEGGEDESEASSDVSAIGGAATLTAAQIDRQNRILEFLKEKGHAQVWEIQNIFPRVSKRTIRRDFRALLEQGLIERTGERNTTAYKLKTYLS